MSTSKCRPSELTLRESALRAGYSAFRRPLLSLLAGMLDDRVRAREYQARVAVIETHQVWRLPPPSPDFDHLPDPLRLAHHWPPHPHPVSRRRPHPPTP